ARWRPDRTRDRRPRHAAGALRRAARAGRRRAAGIPPRSIRPPGSRTGVQRTLINGLRSGARRVRDHTAAGADVQPATAVSARFAGMKRSTSSRVFWILPRLEAPNTIDSMFGCSAIHWMASFGGIAPEANTDMAT